MVDIVGNYVSFFREGVRLSFSLGRLVELLLWQNLISSRNIELILELLLGKADLFLKKGLMVLLDVV